MKMCKCCFEIKYLNEFYKKKRGKDGRMAVCKKCRDIKYAGKISKEQIAKQSKKYRSDNPQKVKCRSMTRTAIRLGELIKCDCFGCGSTEKIEIHHNDYSDHLNITWFCHDCHVLAHRKLRMPEVFSEKG